MRCDGIHAPPRGSVETLIEILHPMTAGRASSVLPVQRGCSWTFRRRECGSIRYIHFDQVAEILGALANQLAVQQMTAFLASDKGFFFKEFHVNIIDSHRASFFHRHHEPVKNDSTTNTSFRRCRGYVVERRPFDDVLRCFSCSGFIDQHGGLPGPLRSPSCCSHCSLDDTGTAGDRQEFDIGVIKKCIAVSMVGFSTHV